MILNITVGATALECVLVPKTGPYKTSNCMTAARSLCEARLVSET